MKVNQLKAGAVLSYIAMGLGYIISILYTPIMLRLLGQSEFGLYNLVASVVSYLGILNFGFGSAYMRYYSRYKVNDDQENVAKLNGMFLIIFSMIGVIAVFAGIVLVLNTNSVLGNELTVKELSTARMLIAIMVLNIAISFPNVVFNSHITANEQFVFQKVLQLIKIVANPFVILPVLYMGHGSVGMVVATTVLHLTIDIVNIGFCFNKLHMKFLFRQFDWSLMKEMTVFSSYIFMNMIVDQINWNVDKFILGRFHGTITVAIYGLAAQLNMYYKSLSTTISSVFIPRINRMVSGANDNWELTRLFTRVGRVQFILLSLIFTGILFFGQAFIYMWAGVDYAESYPILLLLVIPVTLPLIQNIGIEIQKAKNMHQFRSWVYLFIAIANVIISIPLAKTYGGVGAALGTAIALIIGNGIIMNVYYHKGVGLDMRFFWGQIAKLLPALLPSILIGTLMYVYLDLYNVLTFMTCAVIYIIMFSFSMWFLGMNQLEKDLVVKPFFKVVRKLKLCKC